MKSSENILLDFCKAQVDMQLDLPFFEGGVAAGFPSPAEDFADLSLDLNKALIKHPSATFFARVSGVSMVGEGIDDGDLLIIDRSVQPYDGCLAVAWVDGAFTLKRVKVEKDALYLMPANPEYKALKVTEDTDFMVWGVVHYVVKKM